MIMTSLKCGMFLRLALMVHGFVQVAEVVGSPWISAPTMLTPAMASVRLASLLLSSSSVARPSWMFWKERIE
jgi:hypothetical protein